MDTFLSTGLFVLTLLRTHLTPIMIPHLTLPQTLHYEILSLDNLELEEDKAP